MRMRVPILLTLFLPSFLHAQPDPWAQHEIAANVVGALSVTAADGDNDGDQDVFLASFTQGKVFWYENQTPGWVQHVISDSTTGPICIGVGDLDGDYDLDVASVSFSSNRVYWYENTLQGWTRHMLDPAYTHARRVVLADIDGDLDLDIIAISETDGLVVWKNQGGSPWTKVAIPIGDMDTPYGLFVTDMNDDGLTDIVASDYGDNDLFWYQNTGAGWSSHTITTSFNAPLDLYVADVDNDLDLDVAVASDINSKISWLENNGSNNWPQHTVTSNFTDVNDVVARDIDNDSNTDIVACSYSGGMIALWEGSGNNWTQTTLSDGFSNAWSLDLADMDGDNDLDVVSTSYWSGAIDWWEHPGSGFPVTLTMIPQDLPIEIPASGGEFLYGFRLRCFADELFTHARFWNKVIYPDQTESEAFNITTVWILPFMNVHVWNIVQHVPQDAPAGLYTYITRVGYPNNHAEGNFTFTKLGNEATGMPGAGEWESGPVELKQGSRIAGSSRAASAEDFRLLPASPNPFNAATVISLKLPVFAELTVTVYDISGREVARLASGIHSAGEYRFSFDASSLASGMYFVCAQADGLGEQVQKVIRVR